MNKYVVHYIDTDQKSRTVIVEATVPIQFDRDTESRGPFIGKHLRRPMKIKSIEPMRGGKYGPAPQANQ